MFTAEAVSFVEAILAQFSIFCREKNARDAPLFGFDDRHASLCQAPKEGPEAHQRENPVPIHPKIPQSDEIIIPILSYFASVADCFPRTGTQSIVSLTWAVLGYVPRPMDPNWVVESNLKDWEKLADTDFTRSSSLLTHLLNLLSVLQSLSLDFPKIRMAVSKIRNVAFNENLFSVSSLAVSIISEFEVENQFDF